MDDRFFFDVGKFEFSLREAHIVEKYLRFDVKPFGVRQDVIEPVLFSSGKLPKNCDMTSDAFIGEERWNLSWSGSNMKIAGLMKQPFSTALVFGLEAGWLAKVRKRERANAIWRAARQKALGNRSPNQIAEMGFGAYEVTGIGFVWFGQEGSGVELQSQAYFRTPSMNSDFRWYLERGVSLSETRRLSRQQNHEVFLLTIAAFGGVFGGAGGVGSASQDTLSKGLTVLDKGLAQAGVKTRPAGETFTETLMKVTATGRNEMRIQQLARSPRKAITKLKPL